VLTFEQVRRTRAATLGAEMQKRPANRWPFLSIESGKELTEFLRVGFFNFPFDGVVNFLAMDGYVFRCVDSNPHLVAAYFHNRNSDRITNDDGFIALS